VVFVNSCDGVVGEQNLAAYCASKGAGLQLMRAVALDHARQGIRSNAVCPGSINTPFFMKHVHSAPDPVGFLEAKTQRHPDREKLRPVAAPHEEFLWDTPYHWGEWLEPGVDTTDFGVLLTADRADVATPYLHRSAKQMVIAGKILGKPESVLDHYRKVAENTKNAWQKEFITADGLLNPDTQAHYVRALDFGLAPDELHTKFVNRLVELVRAAGTHLGTGFLTTGI
jgi:hypothetical protein